MAHFERMPCVARTGYKVDWQEIYAKAMSERRFKGAARIASAGNLEPCYKRTAKLLLAREILKEIGKGSDSLEPITKEKVNVGLFVDFLPDLVTPEFKAVGREYVARLEQSPNADKARALRKD
ncbi:MAG: hypothetical protein Q7K43_02090, partial [Candidatus Woesearchaeota archaeon]|nr:hypothetical protein [Candidatus Woesearchaeota archaeon]